MANESLVLSKTYNDQSLFSLVRRHFSGPEAFRSTSKGEGKLTFAGLAINMTCVMADGGSIGLCGGNSLPEGG